MLVVTFVRCSVDDSIGVVMVVVVVSNSLVVADSADVGPFTVGTARAVSTAVVDPMFKKQCKKSVNTQSRRLIKTVHMR